MKQLTPAALLFALCSCAGPVPTGPQVSAAGQQGTPVVLARSSNGRPLITISLPPAWTVTRMADPEDTERLTIKGPGVHMTLEYWTQGSMRACDPAGCVRETRHVDGQTATINWQRDRRGFFAFVPWKLENLGRGVRVQAECGSVDACRAAFGVFESVSF